MKRELLLAALCLLCLGLSACGRHCAYAEPSVNVRGQYDVSMGVRK